MEFDKETSGRRGIRIMDGETSIISTTAGWDSYGGDEGKYEIFPRWKGQDFRELFDTADQVTGWLTLDQALEISDACKQDDKAVVEAVAKKYF